MKTRTSAARPDRDRRCVRGEPATAAAPASDRSGGSVQSSSERKVDIRMGFDIGPTEEALFAPGRTIDHSTLLNRDMLVPSPKSS